MKRHLVAAKVYICLLVGIPQLNFLDVYTTRFRSASIQLHILKHYQFYICWTYLIRIKIPSRIIQDMWAYVSQAQKSNKNVNVLALLSK